MEKRGSVKRRHVHLLEAIGITADDDNAAAGQNLLTQLAVVIVHQVHFLVFLDSLEVDVVTPSFLILSGAFLGFRNFIGTALATFLLVESVFGGHEEVIERLSHLGACSVEVFAFLGAVDHLVKVGRVFLEGPLTLVTEIGQAQHADRGMFRHFNLIIYYPYLIPII